MEEFQQLIGRLLDELVREEGSSIVSATDTTAKLAELLDSNPEMCVEYVQQIWSHVMFTRHWRSSAKALNG